MGTLSIWHWLIVLVVVLILFGGRGKISQIMGDFGKGLKAFKKTMREDEPTDEPFAGKDEPKALNSEASESPTTERSKKRDRAARS